jgi:hypothetical protein
MKKGKQTWSMVVRKFTRPRFCQYLIHVSTTTTTNKPIVCFFFKGARHQCYRAAQFKGNLCFLSWWYANVKSSVKIIRCSANNWQWNSPEWQNNPIILQMPCSSFTSVKLSETNVMTQVVFLQMLTCLWLLTSPQNSDFDVDVWFFGSAEKKFSSRSQ